MQEQGGGISVICSIIKINYTQKRRRDEEKCMLLAYIVSTEKKQNTIFLHFYGLVIGQDFHHSAQLEMQEASQTFSVDMSSLHSKIPN